MQRPCQRKCPLAVQCITLGDALQALLLGGQSLGCNDRLAAITWVGWEAALALVGDAYKCYKRMRLCCWRRRRPAALMCCGASHALHDARMWPVRAQQRTSQLQFTDARCRWVNSPASRKSTVNGLGVIVVRHWRGMLCGVAGAWTLNYLQNE